MRKVLVVGDWMVDQYYLGKVTRQCPEAPIPVVTVEDLLKFPGGAGNVYMNLQDLGVEPTALNMFGLHPVKNRLMVGDQMIARWDEWDYCDPLEAKEVSFIGRRRDAVVVADYGKGAITEEVIDAVVDLELPVFVDTKKDPTPWLRCGNVTMFPNRKEYAKYKEAYDQFGGVVLKKGWAGLDYLDHGRVHISEPARARVVRSVVGAGDTVIAAFAASVLAGRGLVESVVFANCAAAIAVEKPYTATAKLEEVQELYRKSCPTLA